MKTKTSPRLLLVGALALALSAAAFAQTADNTTATSSANASQTTPPARQHDRHGPSPLGPLAIFDTNHDGVISADEIANASAVLAKLANKDGQITPKEVRAAFPRPPRDGHHGDRQGPPNGDQQGDHRGPPPSDDGDGSTPPPPPPSDQN